MKGHMLELDTRRLKRYCATIRENIKDIDSLLSSNSDENLIENRYLLKAMKYSLIETSEAMADALQHLLARLKNEAAESYLEVVEKSRKASIIDPDVLKRLLFFFKFRNLLVHRYWEIDNKRLIQETRKGYRDFEAFVEEIEKILK